jgi:hypothetical protein
MMMMMMMMIHDKRLGQNLFIGKEQINMNYVAYKTNHSDFVFFKTWELHDCNMKNSRILYDRWFFYQNYFAIDKYYNCSYENRLSILTNL